jgi:hypothetical protein
MFDRSNIVGVGLFEFIDWAEESFVWLKNYGSKNQKDEQAPVHGVLALPPMQRSAVWRVKQVLDLWDSVLNGMPIGSFYLIEQRNDKRFVTIEEKTVEIEDRGYNLLDGQQRLRALLLGAMEFPFEKRCLWIDLGASDAATKPCIFITSKSQPFGYDSQGQKLGIAARRKAREELETLNNERRCLRFTPDGTGRDVYDSDLFDAKNIYRGGEEISCPQKPYRAGPHTFKLNDLIRAWRPNKSKTQGERIEAFRSKFNLNMDFDHSALKKLDDAFMRISYSEVALIRVKPDNFAFESDVLTLFERIGAGGTALTDNERRYSIYKFYMPHVRDAVNKINTEIGSVLSGTEIAVSAIRIAYSELYTGRKDKNDVVNNKNNYVNMPDVHTFAKEILNLREGLNKLIPANDSDEQNIQLLAAFKKIYHSLCYKEISGNYWVPDIILANLPAELWQVLTYYVVKNPNADLCRQDLVRFVMWWYIFVIDNLKASDLCFRKIKDLSITENPGKFFYAEINHEDIYGYRLVSCKIATEIWFTSGNEDFQWKSYEQRFGKDNNLNKIAAHWWSSSKKSLFWLQKDYLRERFPGFKPLSEHEEDTPYDFDHICPANDFYYYIWDRFAEDVPKNLTDIYRRGRNFLDASIGNYRIVTSSQNRYDSDDDISKKLPAAIRVDNLTDDQKKDLANFALAGDEESLKLWGRVSRAGECKDRLWNRDRLAAFQQAVEHRTAWLYCKFYTELGFAEWETITPETPAPKS